jgi:phosphoribosylaminoimidazole-succinocarboxamide synthase
MTLDMKDYTKVKTGKVRDLYNLDDNHYIIHHSDRLSSFDRHICDVEGKGELLCKTAAWWFEKTQHIIPNHVVAINGKDLLVKKCEVIPIEFVMRGYITGSTSTSLWTHYKNGARTYCGESFPDGLVKNQKLATHVLTPTTKDEHDEPLSCQDIMDRGILTSDEMNNIRDIVFKLFAFGQEEAAKRGLILVDTKYEFGYNKEGNIVLIDEVHTCDSSRFWRASTYKTLFVNGEEPEKLDKDSVRDYVKSKCDPYKDAIPEIPQERNNHVLRCYQELYTRLTGGKGDCLAVILSGSPSDASHVEKIQHELVTQGIAFESHICSAHKKTRELLDILDRLEESINRIIYITVAGRSNALSGVVACNTKAPVIACPPFKDKMDMYVNLHSSTQMPSAVPSMTILEPNNVALACRRMFDL